jgi:hypothetical protein
MKSVFYLISIISGIILIVLISTGQPMIERTYWLVPMIGFYIMGKLEDK